MMISVLIRGAWATIGGATKDQLEACLTAMDPTRFFNRAFKERRWDGKIRFYDGTKFPAGLVGRVTAYYNEIGADVRVVESAEVEPIDLSRFKPDYLPGIVLREYQMDACRALLTNKRGVVKSPTGSGKTFYAAVVGRYLWEERGWKTLIVVPKKGLLDQTAKVLQKLYGDDLKVGRCGDGEKEPGIVTVATAQTLAQFQPSTVKRKVGGRVTLERRQADPVVRKLVQTCEVLLLDETHHASAETWYDISMQSNAIRRLGMSGSPLKDSELADMRMVAATGDMIYSVEATTLIEAGDSAKPKIVAVFAENASGPALPVRVEIRRIHGREVPVKINMPYQEAYHRGIVANDHHNTAVLRAAVWMVERKKQTLVLCRKKDHFLDLQERLEKTGIEFMAVWGDTAIADRNLAKKRLDTGSISLVLASTIWDEGEDVPGIEAVILAEGVKASTSAIQRIGRGMRKKKKGENVVWVVDFVPTNHARLQEHGLQRVSIYEGEGYEVCPLYDWPAIDEEYDESTLLPFEDWDAAIGAV